ncbi:MAG: MG2 domain-containing protein [Syntrophobacterales bacterium]
MSGGAHGSMVQGRRPLRPQSLLKVAALLIVAVMATWGSGLKTTAARTDPGAAFNAAKHFTIKKIVPEASREEVKIFFSQPVPLGVLQANLRLLPRVKLDWNRSRVSPSGVLILKGSFKYGAGHVVTMKDGVTVAGRTYVPTVTTFMMPDRPAIVEFVGAKRVIERDSRQLLHVRVANVENLNLSQIRVPPLLLPQALAAEQAGADLEQTLKELRTAAQQLAPLIQGKSVYAPFGGTPLEEKQLFPAGGEKNRVLAVSLPLSFRQNKEAGALELIRVQDNQVGSGAAAGPRHFRITDLGLTYKVGGKSLLLWVTSIKSGAPAAGVQVLAVTRHAEVFPLGVTDKDGILTFTPRELDGLSLQQLGGFHLVKRLVNKPDITFLLAGKTGDVSYIEVKPHGNLKAEDVWQVTTPEQPQNLKGVVFTERGVYRPGEKVFFKGTVREYRDGAILPPQTKTCLFTVTNPRGEQVFTKKINLSEFGTTAGEMPTQRHWALGTYTLNMTFGPQAEVLHKTKKRHPSEEAQKDSKAPRPEASTTFQVQEFKPPRHFTDITFARFSREDKTYVNRERQAEFVRITITGAYYAGGPVKHGQVRWRISQAPTSYPIQKFDTYSFGYVADDKGVLIESGQAILDAQGKTTVEFPLDRHMLAGRQGISVVATVVDFDGRAAAAGKAFQVEPDFLVGISRHRDSFKIGEEHELQVVVLNKQRQPVSQGTVRAEVLERSWSYVAKRNERGDVYWDDEAIWRRAFTQDLTLKEGKASFQFNCAQPGSYLLVFTFTDPQGQSFSSASQVRVAWEYIPEEKRNRPYQPLALWADRPIYQPGETAHLSISPQGPVSYYLLTLERDGLLFHQVIKGGEGPKNVSLPVKAKYGPNVYVSVLGVTPRGDFPVRPGQYDIQAPGFVWGNLNLPVLKDLEGLNVKINPEVADWRARPGEEVKVNLTVATPKGQGIEAEVALAVVDEAVLALTGYKTPTLTKLTRFDLPLEVFTGELLTLLVHQTPFYPSKVEPLTGGGGFSKDIVDKLRRRFKAVAYFNPQVLTDAQGKAQVSFTLPDNITRYRVFAVAVDRTSRFASVERHLIATKDFYLEPGLPGFFNVGDRFKFQVSATNATAKKGPVAFSVSAEGGLSLKAVDTGGELNPKDSLKLNVSGEATAPGQAKAKFAGEFLGHRDEVELTLPINSGHVRQTVSVLGSFSGNQTVKIPLPAYLTSGAAGKVNLDEVQAVLTLSGSPFLRFTRPINYLLTYPYGCVEQISSGVLGLAALRGLIQQNLIAGISPDKVNKFLLGGVNRLMNLQTAQGGFSYWPGQHYSHPLGSLYALAALSIAKTQGLAVPQAGMEKGLRYLTNKVQYGKVTPLEKAFACYILSLNQALTPAIYQKAMREYPALQREGKLFMILAAYHAKLRSPKMLEAYLKPILSGKDWDKVQGDIIEDDFDARFRGPALAVLAGHDIMPRDPLTQQAALYLLGGVGRQGIWTSTSDTGWALLALGQYYQGASFPEKAGQVTVGQPGGSSQELSWAPGGYRSLSLDAKTLLQNPEVRLQGEKSRTWLYQVDLTYPRLDLKEKGEDHGFKVTKAIKNTNGKDVIRVGDLVKVTLEVEIQGLARRYVVLDDPLPAGLVALNTALKTEEPVPEKAQDLYDYVTPDGVIRFFPNHFEIRQDRVLAFRDRVYPGTFRFEYYARAVCEGDFVLPPTQAAAMYNPGVQGFSSQGRLAIKGR